MIQTLKSMMTELLKFFVLTGTIFFMFLAIGNILLYDTRAFNSMQ